MISVFPCFSLLATLIQRVRAYRLRYTMLLVGSLLFTLGGCGQLSHSDIVNKSDSAEAGEFFQTNVDRMATLAMRDNLNSLYRLLDKLYRRNPAEWRKTGQPTIEAAEKFIQTAIEQNRDLPSLNGLRDI